MAGGYFYLITSLPPLGGLGSRPPLTPAELLDKLDEPGLRPLVEAVFLGDDLLARESLASGEAAEVTPSVLDAAQLRDEAPLPEYLVPQGQPANRKVPADALWETYYRWLADQGEKLRSEFLRRWTAFEVGLRNALAAARAKALELDAGEYLVATDLGTDAAEYTRAVQEWSSAPDALEGQKALDRFRWDWITANDAWFSFGGDELAAYAARLMLLNRWQRLEENRQASRDESAERTQP